MNAHKWLFTPLDASLFLCRRLELARAAFSLNPEYLRTLDRSSPVRDYNEFQPQLGRRFRALKLWMLVRWFGVRDSGGGCSATLSSAGVRVVGGRRAGLGAHGTRPVLDCLLPAPTAEPRRRRRGARRPQCGHHGGGEPDGRSLPVPHAAQRPVRDPAVRRQPADGGTARGAGLAVAADGRPGGGAPSGRSRSSTSTERSGVPTTSSSLFLKNHWPILRDQIGTGRHLNVEMWTPRFHGDGRSDWDVLVSITYRDWAAIEEHSDAEIARRLFPDQATFKKDERRRFEPARSALGRAILSPRELPGE